MNVSYYNSTAEKINRVTGKKRTTEKTNKLIKN